MGLRRAVARLAAGGPVPVFPLLGAGATALGHDLAYERRISLVDSPCSANVLVVGGEITSRLLRPALAVHDGMAHPRATLWVPLGASTARFSSMFPQVTVLDPGDDPLAAIVDVHERLLSGLREADPAALPVADPALWRGVGPYGQGGTGMTGGIPFGRPMAGRAPDRDGLELDKLDVTVGPFFSALPRGLVLDVHLQGDILQKVSMRANPFERRRSQVVRDVFHQALHEPVMVRELEVARARHHLFWLSGMLRVHGLSSLGYRTLALARDLAPGSLASVRGLRRLLHRTPGLDWATARVGVLPEVTVRRAGGPVARAAGHECDARLDDPAYVGLGFAPVVHEGGDARARWRQRLSEAVQALEIAQIAGSRHTETTAQVEGPRGVRRASGSSAKALLHGLTVMLEGLEWGDAVAALMSLDLDLEALA